MMTNTDFTGWLVQLHMVPPDLASQHALWEAAPHSLECLVQHSIACCATAACHGAAQHGTAQHVIPAEASFSPS